MSRWIIALFCAICVAQLPTPPAAAEERLGDVKRHPHDYLTRTITVSGKVGDNIKKAPDDPFSKKKFAYQYTLTADRSELTVLSERSDMPQLGSTRTVTGQIRIPSGSPPYLEEMSAPVDPKLIVAVLLGLVAVGLAAYIIKGTPPKPPEPDPFTGEYAKDPGTIVVWACQGCGVHNDEADRYCTGCGQERATSMGSSGGSQFPCPYCKSMNSGEAASCWSCREPLHTVADGWFAQLEAVRGDEPPESVDLKIPYGGTLIGRLPRPLTHKGGYIQLSGSSVSAEHARISRQNQQGVIENLSKTNGTFVNEMQITQEHPLQDGDEIRIGNTTFRYTTR